MEVHVKNLSKKREKLFTDKSSAQKEAIAPPIECPVTMMGISPYNFLALFTAFRRQGRILVL